MPRTVSADSQTGHLTLYDSVVAAIGGIHEDQASMQDQRIPVEDCYRAFSLLASEFPESFPGVYFSRRSGVPYSRDIEDVLFQAGAWRLIEDNNPDYRYFTVPAATRRLIKEQLSKIHSGKTGDLEQVSLRFKSVLEELKRVESHSL